ncbi:hypothetical protein ACHAW6_015912 [Cyclotella cf. meneghiniana]
MAVAFRINRPSDLASIFAAHDEFISILADARGDFPREEMAEVYTAPFCFMPGRFKDRGDEGGWLFFTPRVPWTHDVHIHAVNEMKRSGFKLISIEKSVESCQDMLRLREGNVYTFTKHGGYPRIEDNVGPALDEEAVRITCAAMGWKVPKDWQDRRLELCHQHCINRVLNIEEFSDECNKDKDPETQHLIGDNVDIKMNGNGGEIFHM